MNLKIKAQTLLVALSMAASGLCSAAGINTSQDIQARQGNPSPVDKNTGSSVNQFSNKETNSRVDDYINQDEQVNIDPKDGVVKVLRTNQKVQVNDFVPKMIPVYRANVTELRQIAREIAGMEGGTAENIKDPQTKENFIYVVVPRFQLPYVEEAIRKLDEEWVNPTEDGSVTETYVAKHRDVRDIHRLAFLPTSRDFTTVAIDTLKNSATYTEDAGQMKAYLMAAGKLDIPVNEITVEAQFIEVNVANDQKIGLDYINWRNGPGRNLFDLLFAGVNNSEHFKGASSIFNPLTPLLPPAGDGDYRHVETTGRQRYANANFFATAAYLDYLQSKGRAKTLAAPVIQTRSARLASWSSIDPVAAITVSGSNNKLFYNQPNSRSVEGADDETRALADSGDLGTWDRFVNYGQQNSQRAGIFLDILPFVGTETTEMFIHASINSITGTTPRGMPIIAARSVTSDVRTQDGQTLVLGGMKRIERVKDKNGIPFLSEIPILGYLFGNETTVNRETTVVVTLDTNTSIGAGSSMELTEPMAATVAQVKAATMPPVPENPAGFDQWLLDPSKQPVE